MAVSASECAFIDRFLVSWESRKDENEVTHEICEIVLA